MRSHIYSSNIELTCRSGDAPASPTRAGVLVTIEQITDSGAASPPLEVTLGHPTHHDALPPYAGEWEKDRYDRRRDTFEEESEV